MQRVMCSVNAPAGARFVVCRVLVRTAGLTTGRKVAMVVGERVRLRAGPVRNPAWCRVSRPLSEIEILRDATKLEVLTGVIGTDAAEAGSGGARHS